MTPKDNLTKRDITSRRKGWEEQRQSCHWASAGQFSLFARNPRIYKSAESENQKAMVERAYAYQRAQTIQLTELGKSLLDVLDEPHPTSQKKRKQSTLSWDIAKPRKAVVKEDDD
jgi:hypothetical protein